MVDDRRPNDPILIDFFKEEFRFVTPVSVSSSSSKEAKFSVSFFFLFVTVSTALEAHPATLRRRGVGALSRGSVSFSPVAVALLFVRFLDNREADRDAGLLP